MFGDVISLQSVRLITHRKAITRSVSATTNQKEEELFFGIKKMFLAVVVVCEKSLTFCKRGIGMDKKEDWKK